MSRLSTAVAPSRYILVRVSDVPSPSKESSMNKLLAALVLGAFALVQVPVYAQAAKPAAAPAAPAASAAKKADAKADMKAEKKAPKKEKKGGC